MSEPTTIPTRRGRPPAFTEEQLRAALAEADNVVATAARLLEVAESTVWRAVDRYGIEIRRVVEA